MPISKLAIPDTSSHGLDNTVSSFNPIVGTCGNCGLPAINAFEYICKDCCIDVGLSTFPLYTYPSELMYNTDADKAVRSFFIRGY